MAGGELEVEGLEARSGRRGHIRCVAARGRAGQAGWPVGRSARAVLGNLPWAQQARWEGRVQQRVEGRRLRRGWARPADGHPLLACPPARRSVRGSLPMGTEALAGQPAAAPPAAEAQAAEPGADGAGRPAKKQRAPKLSAEVQGLELRLRNIYTGGCRGGAGPQWLTLFKFAEWRAHSV